MITYVYTAKNTHTNELVKAEVQAESESAAAKLLLSQNLFPISITSKDKASGNFTIGSGVSAKDRVIFSRQLATLINAGLPLTQSLRTVRDQIASKKLQEIVDQVVVSVEGGSALSAAFAEHPKVFSNIFVSLIAAGEATGTLDKSLNRVADQQEKDAAITSKIRSALVYPIIVLVVIIGVLIFMLTTVLPQIAKLYHDLKRPLPLATSILNGLSVFMTRFWWLIVVAVVAAGFGVRTYIATESGRKVFDQFKMRLPVFGILFRKVYMARFARTMGSMMGAGIPMLQGLEIVRKSVGNVVVGEVVAESIVKVRGGAALSSTLENQPAFLPLVPQMIKIGEQSGAIDQLLDRIAKYYEDEVDETVKNLSVTIEPILMVVLGLLVGGIIAAVLLPVYSLVGAGNLGG